MRFDTKNSKHMMFFYRLITALLLVYTPFIALSQVNCPNFKNHKKGTFRSGGLNTVMKVSIEANALIVPKPFEFIPIMSLGGETAFLRYFTFGYNMGFTVKKENQNVESGRFEGLLLRPELRFYLPKAFNGYWIGGQYSVFFQNVGFNEGLKGVQIGKANFNGRHKVVNYYAGWAYSKPFHTVGVGISWGYLWK